MKFTTDPTTGTRTVTGTNTYLDGSEYYGPEEFEAEHGCTFVEFMERMATEPAPEGEPADFFVDVKRRR